MIGGYEGTGAERKTQRGGGQLKETSHGRAFGLGSRRRVQKPIRLARGRSSGAWRQGVLEVTRCHILPGVGPYQG